MINFILRILDLLIIGIFFILCSKHLYSQSASGNLDFPVATKYATILYVSDSVLKVGNMKGLASHYVLKGTAQFTWEKQIREAGNYEVVLGYSVRKEGASIKVGSGKDTISDVIQITKGVYTDNTEWYQFNCERKSVKGQLYLSEGLNSITLKIIAPDNDFETIVYTLELIPSNKKSAIIKEVTDARKARPRMDWLASMKYGVMFHWTSQSAPRSGPVKAYKEAVKDFNVNAFTEMVEKTGADYIIFTGNHAEPHFPAPLKEWGKEYPGWTTERDLISEIADALRKRNIKFILYLAAHIYAKQDKVSTKEFERLNNQLISEIGERYKDKIDAYWFDGFYQSYKSHPTFNFEKFYKTSKVGNSNRLLALNSWLYPIVTEWQDYWAGEVYTPGALPDTRIVQSGPGKGLQYQSLVVLENDWVHDKVDTRISAPRLRTDNLINYINSCAGKGPVTINLGIYQDGTIGEEALTVMETIKQKVK